MFVSVKIANHVANRAEEIADTIQNQVSSTEILFVTNQKLMSLLSDMQVFGDITLKEKILSKPQTHKSLQQVTMTQTSKKSDEDFSRSSLMKIEGSKKYNVKVNSDKSNCNIINLCILEDGTIILADHCNKNLKRMDPSTFTVQDSCDVAQYPHQVVAISNREVAVSCSTSKLIQFVSVENTMKMTRQITGYDCCGLAFADGKLFVSSRISIVVISLSGDRQQLFGLDEFTQSRLAVSSDNSKIYVTGHNKCFVILDRNGSPVGGFNGPELRTPYDVCLDKNGNVLICGFNSKNVLQFSPGGKLTGEVLKTEKQCQALCCDKNNTKLIVGLNREDEIEVYDISGK